MSDTTTILLTYTVIGLIVVLLWIVGGLIGANMYEKKGRSAVLGFLVAFLLGPIGLLLILVTPANVERAAAIEKRQKLRSVDFRECPHCFEVIDIRAAVCPNCKRDIYPKPESSKTPAP